MLGRAPVKRFLVRSMSALAFSWMVRANLERKFDHYGDEIWRADEHGQIEMNASVPEDAEEIFAWAEKTQTAIAALSYEVAQLKAGNTQASTAMNLLGKRQKITESRLARLTENEKKEQRLKVERCLDIRGLRIPGSERLATIEEREATFRWIAG